MTRAQRWALILGNLAVTGTGLAYGWACYFAESDDPFSIVNHPWQPHLQHLHVLAAPLLVFVTGMLWPGHIGPLLRSAWNDPLRSGVVLGSSFLPMVLSGYLLQVTVDETWLRAWRWTHIAASLSWIVFLFAHSRRPLPPHRGRP